MNNEAIELIFHDVIGFSRGEWEGAKKKTLEGSLTAFLLHLSKLILEIGSRARLNSSCQMAASFLTMKGRLNEIKVSSTMEDSSFKLK